MGIGSTPALIVGTAVGGAAAAAFEPALEIPRQEAWKSAPNRLPDVALIAELVAGGKVQLQDGRDMAARLGFAQGPFDSITWLTQNRLDFPAMLRMWRLSAVNPDFDEAGLSELVDETLAHDRLDWNYHPYLRALKTAELPGIGDIAFAVVRGILPSPAYVPVAPGTGGQYVKPYPQLNIDPEQLAAALGYSPEMLELLVGRAGLSMAPVMAANALFRTKARLRLAGLPAIPGAGAFDLTPVMDDADYLLAIGQGDLRTNYADAVRSTAREILTAGEYAELELRGYLTREQRLALTAQHGMSDGDSDLAYDVKGRGLSLHAAFIAERRGGVFNGDTAAIPDWALWMLQRGNLRPETYNLAWAGRETLPSAFVIRSLLKDGALTEAQGETLFLHSGWPEDLAALVAKHYATSSGTVADPHVAKAQTQLWATLHRSYLAGETDTATATTMLGTVGVATAAIPQVLALWEAEQTLVRKQLTPAQLKKAYANAEVNPATGVAWTLDEVVARLIGMGYSHNDALTFLGE